MLLFQLLVLIETYFLRQMQEEHVFFVSDINVPRGYGKEDITTTD